VRAETEDDFRVAAPAPHGPTSYEQRRQDAIVDLGVGDGRGWISAARPSRYPSGSLKIRADAGVAEGCRRSSTAGWSAINRYHPMPVIH
jgi:hypothetical protein